MAGVYPPGADVRSWACLSDDGLYRYELTRQWGPEDTNRIPTFVMLNPSTADHKADDPTIRRCVGFARSWGYDGLRVVNLYAFRATNPSDLWTVDDPTGGAMNDDTLDFTAMFQPRGVPIVAAWGAHARPDRVAAVLALRSMNDLFALGLTKAGAPRHPLYLPATARPTPWVPPTKD